MADAPAAGRLPRAGQGDGARAGAACTVVRVSHTSSETALQPLDWSAGRWSHAPVATSRSPAGVLSATAAEGSDAWRHTSYGFVHDTEHALLAPLPPDSAMEVEFGTPFSQQFDQAGIFVRATQEHWVKAGIEFADGVPQIGAVVTDRRSDWSASPAPEWAEARVTFRISWAGDALTIRARRERTAWQLVRVLPFDARDGVSAGPFLCAPTRAGLEVPFYSWRTGAPDGSLH